MTKTRQKLNFNFEFHPFSKKQLQVLTWWAHQSPYANKDAIIADGSVRAGKTVVMSLSYVIWAMTDFNGQNFGLAGKTIGSLRRNVLSPLIQMLKSEGFQVFDRRSESYVEITRNGKTNYFYLFGGKDESSYQLVQGLTAAGFFFDEVVLQPESFVNQATTRVSVKGGKFWFNGNPEGPYHWFKREWIDKLTEKNAIRIHFMMDDNPSLDQSTRDRYERLYSGVFYQRYILGLWVMSEGVIYANFDKSKMVVDLPADTQFEKSWVSADYGTQNATVFKLWRLFEGVWYNTDEYYYSGREKSIQRTDKQFREDLEQFYERNDVDRRYTRIILDPAAASFKAELIQHGFSVKKANNDVVNGIRSMMSAMDNGLVKWTSKATNTFKEFQAYIWDAKAADKGEDKPVKEHDHAMDADRYFVYSVVSSGAAKVKTYNVSI
ncbi:phage terminase large subunit [Weissella oryzae SG25]|uniref:Phage terminase large subunit n=1 Tax=Weissella oryzae (strain DSM 25784 / JCM 18191 / LMG 30913 / SG25) TaxID=1329250 RepID=A0A069CT77_WEIOS|nr:PBSX family phage terminase large subunit [Weissella oryzae]GAK31015.1 phage terminase large subunit [Weissella oryzae SG25]